MFEGQVDNDEMNIPDGMSLPLQTDVEVESFDAALKEDADMRKALVMINLCCCITLWLC